MDTENALASFASSLTNGKSSQIQQIPVDHLVTNEKNFYGLRDIDELAGMIAVSNYVEPLVVTPMHNSDNFLLIAGHRRLAAWKKLLEDGTVTEHTLPCVVKTFQHLAFDEEDGSKKEFSEEDAAFYYLILSNMGQRKERTVQEQLQEIQSLRPLANAIYAEKLQEGTVKGSFRRFFANEFLNMGESSLQRKLTLEKLSQKVLSAVDDGVISETAATQLASLSVEEQDQYIDEILAGNATGKVTKVREETDQIPVEKVVPEEEEPSSEEASSDEGDETHEESPVEESSEEDSPSVAPVDEPNPYQTQEKASSAPALHRIPVPESFEDPQKEANNWWEKALQDILKDAEEQQAFYESQGDHVKSAQWNIRVGVAKYQIAKLEESNN